MHLSRSTARPARKRSRLRHASRAGRPLSLLPGPTDLPGAHRSAPRSGATRGADAFVLWRRVRRAARERSLFAAARGRLGLGRRGQGHRQGTTRSGQAALHAGDVVPGYALSAGRAVRHWHDEAAAVETLISLGLDRDDVIEEALRSPKRVEIRTKARRPQSSQRIDRFAAVRRVAGSERERARPGARTGRNRAVILRGTYRLPRREA